MTLQVDFYVIDAPSANRHDRLICRIVEKAWQQGHSVYIRCADSSGVRNIDDLLWQFKDVSFVPHALEDDDTNPAPVSLGMSVSNSANADILVNLGVGVPESAQRFQRVIETAGYDDITRTAARKRYRHYQDQGLTLNTHKVSG